MPPGYVRTIEDLIYYQYSKMIAKSAGKERQYGFVTSKFKELKSGRIHWSTTIREWLKEHEKKGVCIYCGDQTNLTVEHILPRSCGGPDSTDNAVMVCKSCNSAKGGKRLYEWYGRDNKDEVPRIAMGKYLKLLYSIHEERGTLHVDKTGLVSGLCPECDLGTLCKEEGHEGALTVYCLEGILHN